MYLGGIRETDDEMRHIGQRERERDKHMYVKAHIIIEPFLDLFLVVEVHLSPPKRRVVSLLQPKHA
jgi:hypothetical protein